MTNYRFQTDANRKGEIEHRRIMAETERKNPELFLSMVRERMNETKVIFRKLNLPINSHWRVGELGADRCQRILALMEMYDLKKAYAYDISPEMLKLSRFVSKASRKLVLMPGDFMDARSKRLDLVICFATIHHFPDPRPVFAKAYSMLSPGGYFYFDREPLKSFLYLHEVKRWWGALRYGREPETKYGILEDSFHLEEWLEGFDMFREWNIHLTYPHTPYKLDMNRVQGSKWLSLLAKTTGGRLSGLLRK